MAEANVLRRALSDASQPITLDRRRWCRPPKSPSRISSSRKREASVEFCKVEAFEDRREVAKDMRLLVPVHPVASPSSEEEEPMLEERLEDDALLAARCLDISAAAFATCPTMSSSLMVAARLRFKRLNPSLPKVLLRLNCGLAFGDVSMPTAVLRLR
mmetsp:Transcript_25018/g.45874  ORF Transcript_25018/g.45874 Transcript_25018/m.45874 type:complete len:158 (+) Transcript_25018:726-1199(+)